MTRKRRLEKRLNRDPQREARQWYKRASRVLRRQLKASGPLPPRRTK